MATTARSNRRDPGSLTFTTTSALIDTSCQRRSRLAGAENPSGLGEFLRLHLVDLGIAKIQRSQCIDDRGCDDDAREPFVVGRHHVPGSSFGRRVADRALVGLLVVVPELALLRIAARELPVLVGIVQALEEPLLLLFLGHVKEELADHDPVARQVPLDTPDVLKALFPDALSHQARGELLGREELRVDADGEGLLVVAAVEDADAAPL